VSFFLSFNLENIAKTKHKGVNLNKKRPKTVTPFEEIGNFDLLAGSGGLIGVPMNWEGRGRRKKAVGISVVTETNSPCLLFKQMDNILVIHFILLDLNRTSNSYIMESISATLTRIFPCRYSHFLSLTLVKIGNIILC